MWRSDWPKSTTKERGQAAQKKAPPLLSVSVRLARMRPSAANGCQARRGSASETVSQWYKSQKEPFRSKAKRNGKAYNPNFSKPTLHQRGRIWPSLARVAHKARKEQKKMARLTYGTGIVAHVVGRSAPVEFKNYANTAAAAAAKSGRKSSFREKNPCACKAFKEADLLYQKLPQTKRDKWRTWKVKKNWSPYDAFMHVNLTKFQHCASALLDPPEQKTTNPILWPSGQVFPKDILLPCMVFGLEVWPTAKTIQIPEPDGTKRCFTYLSVKIRTWYDKGTMPDGNQIIISGRYTIRTGIPGYRPEIKFNENRNYPARDWIFREQWNEPLEGMSWVTVQCVVMNQMGNVLLKTDKKTKFLWDRSEAGDCAPPPD
jgi:hypothetical protein